MEKLSVQFSSGDPDGNSRCGLDYKYPAHGGKTKSIFRLPPSLAREGCSPRARLVGCGGICPSPAFLGVCGDSVGAPSPTYRVSSCWGSPTVVVATLAGRRDPGALPAVGHFLAGSLGREGLRGATRLPQKPETHHPQPQPLAYGGGAEWGHGPSAPSRPRLLTAKTPQESLLWNDVEGHGKHPKPVLLPSTGQEPPGPSWRRPALTAPPPPPPFSANTLLDRVPLSRPGC